MTADQERRCDAAGERMFQSMGRSRDGVVPKPNVVSEFWDGLGREMGFDPDTVEFSMDTDDDGFTAEVI